MDGTILSQGFFSAAYAGANPNPGNATNQAGDAQLIVIPSNVDWLRVVNYTKYGANGLNSVYFQGTANAFAGVEYIWQRGMAAGTGIVKYKSNSASALQADTLVTGGFTLYDPSGQSAGALPLIGAAVATTASTNATRPVVSTASTAGVNVGTVVRMSNTAQTDVNGIDMVVGAVTVNTSFTLLFAGNALATAPGAIGGAGFYRIVNVDAPFYPRRRFVTNITRATNGQVSVSVAHGLTPGQRVRFVIPAVSGMIQLNAVPDNNYLSAYVVSVVDDYNFTINVDTSAFTAFTWPTIAQQPSNFPQVEPFGEDTAASLSSLAAQTPSVGGFQIYNTNNGILADSTVNTGFLGMLFGGGGNGLALTTPISGPAGTVHFSSADAIDARDVMYWVAGKSSLGGL
jgi:hypothetical protein